MNVIKIRPASKKDIGEIAKIFRQEFSKEPYNENWTEKTSVKRIGDYFHYAKLLVAICDKKTAGFIIFLKFFWHDGFRIMIDEIAVGDEFQGKGIGKALMNEVELISKRNKVKTIILYSHVNSNAYKFYQNLGYNKTNWVSFEKEIK